jgi:hypothetical protein
MPVGIDRTRVSTTPDANGAKGPPAGFQSSASMSCLMASGFAVGA